MLKFAKAQSLPGDGGDGGEGGDDEDDAEGNKRTAPGKRGPTSGPRRELNIEDLCTKRLRARCSVSSVPSRSLSSKPQAGSNDSAMGRVCVLSASGSHRLLLLLLPGRSAEIPADPHHLVPTLLTIRHNTTLFFLSNHTTPKLEAYLKTFHLYIPMVSHLIKRL